VSSYLPEALPCHNSLLHLVSSSPSTSTASCSNPRHFSLNPFATLPITSLTHNLQVFCFHLPCPRCSFCFLGGELPPLTGSTTSGISCDGISTTVTRITKLVTLQCSLEHQTLATQSPLLCIDGRDHTGIAQLSLATFALFGPPSRRFLPPHLVYVLTPIVNYFMRPALSHTVQRTCTPTQYLPLANQTQLLANSYLWIVSCQHPLSSAANIHLSSHSENRCVTRTLYILQSHDLCRLFSPAAHNHCWSFPNTTASSHRVFSHSLHATIVGHLLTPNTTMSTCRFFFSLLTRNHCHRIQQVHKCGLSFDLNLH